MKIMDKPRLRTGLRNRHRTGRSTYSRENKAAVADRYGEFENGRRKTADRIR